MPSVLGVFGKGSPSCPGKKNLKKKKCGAFRFFFPVDFRLRDGRTSIDYHQCGAFRFPPVDFRLRDSRTSIHYHQCGARSGSPQLFTEIQLTIQYNNICYIVTYVTFITLANKWSKIKVSHHYFPSSAFHHFQPNAGADIISEAGCLPCNKVQCSE